MRTSNGLLGIVGNDVAVYMLEIEALLKSNKSKEALEKVKTLYAHAKDIFPSEHIYLAQVILLKAYADFINGNTEQIQNVQLAQAMLKSIVYFS